MIVYLAGTEVAGGNFQKDVNTMLIYLAGQNGKLGIVNNMIKPPQKADIALLESFYYATEWTEKVIPHVEHFMLDSGAFSFRSKNPNVSWNKYLEQYAEFIVRNNVQLYFELDIDTIVGYEKVKDMRRTLERLTGRPPIPVWHPHRGKQEYLQHVHDYPYVALGGVVGDHITRKDKKAYEATYDWFIKEAHAKDVKIHCLGKTSMNTLVKHRFDSVDSTDWTIGNRFGFLYRFDGRNMQKLKGPAGARLIRPKEVALHNFNEWVKFQRYAKEHL